jgi:hypothetical protein
MSKSRKKHPIGGVTTAKSEKQDKRIINRRLRHISKQILKDNEVAAIFPVKNDIMTKWDMSKDGKVRVDKSSKWYRKSLRK